MPEDTVSRILECLGDLRAEVASNTVETKNVVARLDKQNGTVIKHEEKLGAILIRLAERELNCPLLAPVQAYVAQQQGKDSESSVWVTRLLPLVYTLAGGLGTFAIARLFGK
jgi:hypothetical protein